VLRISSFVLPTRVPRRFDAQLRWAPLPSNFFTVEFPGLGDNYQLASLSVPTWDGWVRPPICEGRSEVIRAAWRQPGACPPTCPP